MRSIIKLGSAVAVGAAIGLVAGVKLGANIMLDEYEKIMSRQLHRNAARVKAQAIARERSISRWNAAREQSGRG